MLSRKVVKVFLASPSDLAEERIAAHNVVEEFNQTWADQFGYHIDLVGWEDTVSSHGRPQSIINLELEQCELFYGMIWKRWGTPPAKSGPFTSGFEEEFRSSQMRFANTGRPAIKLALKTIDPEAIRDPGVELAKVIAFKEALIAEREILFETFNDLEDFKCKFRRAISTYVQQLTKIEKEETEHEAAISTPLITSVSKPLVATELLSLEGAQFLRSFIAKTESVSDENVVTSFEVARFRLLGSIAHKQGNDEHTLGVHDANVIYENAAGVKFGRKETLGLIYSGFEHIQHENIPLWHWLRKWDEVNFSMFSLFGPVAVQVGALSAMTLIAEPINEITPFDREEQLTLWFSVGVEDSIKIAALNYLAECGITTDLSHIRAELDRGDYQTRGPATDAFFSILLRDSRQQALEALIELQTDSLSNKLIQEMFAVPSSLELASLLKATEHRNSAVRRTTTKILRERSALPMEIAEQLVTDPAADIRMEALQALKARGRQFSDAEAKEILVKSSNQGLLGWGDREGEANYKRLRNLQLRQLSEQELNVLIDKALPFNEDEYLARAETYYRQHGNSLKAAVENGFEDHFRLLLEKLSTLAPLATTKTFETLSIHMKQSLTRKALSIIERKGNADDICLVRRALRSKTLKWANSDAYYLMRFGEWQDIHVIAELVEAPDYGTSGLATLLSFDDDDRYRKAAKAIYKLSRTRFRELLSYPFSRRLMERFIIEITDKAFRELDYSSMKQLFSAETDSVRKIAVIKAIKALSYKQTKELLSKYMREEKRYYNIIYWLDFGANAPRDRISATCSKILARISG